VSAAAVVLQYKPKGREKEADAIFESALSIDPGNLRAAQLFERVLRRRGGRWDDLAAHLERSAEAVEPVSAKVDLLFRAARTHAARRNDIAAAERLYRRILELDPGNGPARRFVVAILTERERWDDLADFYEAQIGARAEDGADIGLLVQAGMTHWRVRNDPARAEPFFRRLRDVSPEHPAVRAFFEANEANEAPSDEPFPRARGGRAGDRRRDVPRAGDDAFSCARARLRGPRARPAERARRRGDRRAGRRGPGAGARGGDRARDADGPAALPRSRRRCCDRPFRRRALARLYEARRPLEQPRRAVPPGARVPRRRAPRHRPDGEPRAQARDPAGDGGASTATGSPSSPWSCRPTTPCSASSPATATPSWPSPQSYEKLGRYTDVIKVLDQQVEHTDDPAENVTLLRRVAQLWVERFNNVNNATRPLEQIVAIDPTDADALAQLKDLYTKRRAWRPLFDVSRREAERLRATRAARRAGRSSRSSRRRSSRRQRPTRSACGARRSPSTRRRPARSTRSRSSPSASATSSGLAEVLERRAGDRRRRAEGRVLMKLGAVYGERIGGRGALHRRVASACCQVQPKHPKALRVLRDVYTRRATGTGWRRSTRGRRPRGARRGARQQRRPRDRPPGPGGVVVPRGEGLRGAAAAAREGVSQLRAGALRRPEQRRRRHRAGADLPGGRALVAARAALRGAPQRAPRGRPLGRALVPAQAAGDLAPTASATARRPSSGPCARTGSSPDGQLARGPGRGERRRGRRLARARRHLRRPRRRPPIRSRSPACGTRAPPSRPTASARSTPPSPATSARWRSRPTTPR
jgi:Tfp pilus assembly protein PilF